MATTNPMRRRHVLVVTLAALGLSTSFGLSLASAHGGGNGDGRSPVGIKAQDDCEPNSFNAAIGPGTCVGDGDTTFNEFIDQLIADKSADGWQFSRTRHKVKAGRDLLVVNEGGEFHTFSEVAVFTGGCVSVLNGLLGLPAAPECLPGDADGTPRVFFSTGIPPGGKLTVSGLNPGVHRFECLIHPWMHSTITVR